jgi:hypothetical protein
MSFHYHPGAYEQIKLKQAELIAEADLDRRLRAAAVSEAGAQPAPSLVARARLFCGRQLIALGEWIVRPVAAAARP